MTAEELAAGTARMRHLQEIKPFDEVTMRRLDLWWRDVLRREQNKVVSLDEYREKRKWLR